MNVRVLTVADLAAYRALHRFGLIQAPEAFVATAADDARVPDEDVAKMLARGEAWGVFGGDRLIGKLVIDALPFAALAHTRWLHAIYLHPEARGAGVGDMLVRAAMADAHGNGVTRFSLWVNTENAPARRFYERLGFREAGRIPQGISIDGRLMDDVLMCLAVQE